MLILDQWPDYASLNTLSNNASARQRLSSKFYDYADHIITVKRQYLDIQQGATADDARGAFERAATHSAEIANVNTVKSSAYRSAYEGVANLRYDLTTLAEEGNNRIAAINESKKAVAEKISKILEVITEIRGRASGRVAGCLGHISEQVGVVLDTQGIDKSPTAFADNHGLELVLRRPLERQDLETQIGRTLDQLQAKSSANLPANGTTKFSESEIQEPNAISAEDDQLGKPNAVLSQANFRGQNASAVTDFAGPESAPTQRNLPGQNATTPASRPAADASPLEFTLPSQSTTPSNAGPQTYSDAVAVVDTPTGNPSPLATPAASPPSSAMRSTGTASIDASAFPSAPPSAGNTHASAELSPQHLAEGLNTGHQTGAPVSAVAEAVSTAAASPVHTAPPPLVTPIVETAHGPQPAFEVAHSAAPSIAVPETGQMNSLPTEAAQTVIATPTPAVAPTMAPPTIGVGPAPTPAPTPPHGLIAYGADLRPPAVTAPTPPMPPSTTPVSAPMNAGGGAATSGQPAVVRNQTPPPGVQKTAVAALTERAVAANAVGAMAGTVTKETAAQNRLRRLLDAVVRQQPHLHWALGDLEDGTTLLVTDLAGGWIPPNVQIPTGVRLLTPADRRGGLAALLGRTTREAAYTPGQLIDPDDATDPVRMSIRARDTAVVADLGWELSQATKWRDGLPRLAHTLAKALSARTGCLDSEVELLRDYLSTVSHTVLARYPESVDPIHVGNWQLLATIDALINDHKTLANYHFAWFQAHTQEVRR